MTKEERKEYDKRRYQINKEKYKKYSKEYYWTHKEEHNKKMQEYFQTHKEQKKEYDRKYRQANKEKYVKQAKQWKDKNPEKAREINKKHKNKRERNLGFNPLNKWFEGCKAHHINFNDVICIPKELHKSIPHCLETGRNMALINSVAYQFLMGNYIVYE